MINGPPVNDQCPICKTSPSELEELLKRADDIVIEGESIRRAQGVEDAMIRSVELRMNFWMHQAGWHRAHLKAGRVPLELEVRTAVDELEEARKKQVRAAN